MLIINCIRKRTFVNSLNTKINIEQNVMANVIQFYSSCCPCPLFILHFPFFIFHSWCFQLITLSNMITDINVEIMKKVKYAPSISDVRVNIQLHFVLIIGSMPLVRIAPNERFVTWSVKMIIILLSVAYLNIQYCIFFLWNEWKHKFSVNFLFSWCFCLCSVSLIVDDWTETLWLSARIWFKETFKKNRYLRKNFLLRRFEFRTFLY